MLISARLTSTFNARSLIPTKTRNLTTLTLASTLRRDPRRALHFNIGVRTINSNNITLNPTRSLRNRLYRKTKQRLNTTLGTNALRTNSLGNVLTLKRRRRLLLLINGFIIPTRNTINNIRFIRGWLLLCCGAPSIALAHTDSLHRKTYWGKVSQLSDAV